MQNQHRFLKRTATAAALLALLAACTPTPPRPAPSVTDAAPVAAAEAVVARKSADEYLALAARHQPPRRQEYLLLAAGALTAEGRVAQAEQLLRRIQTAPLGPEPRLRKRLVQAQIDLARGNAEAVLRGLETPAAGLSDELRLEIFETRARAYLAAGNALEAANERVQLEPLLADRAARERNRRAIFEALSRLTPTTLSVFRTAPPPDVLSGWLEFVEARKRAAGDPVDLERRLAQWRARYPGHPASGEAPAPTAAELKPLDYPDTIALLLPLSGKLAPAGRAVRDGLLAAYYEGGALGARPEVRLYDTAADPDAIFGVYRQALADGARMMVGPLDKEVVARLVAGGPPDVPVLALNQVDGNVESGLYQFGLAPEDDARSAATRASLDGYRRALLLTPQGEWGERVAAAFDAQWQALGGEVVERAAYNPSEADFSQPIRELLDLDQSELRYRALRRLLGTKIEFEPRRREDVEMLFLAGFPRQARLIRPQMRFHQAADLPLYATSHVFTGAVDAGADRDMDGMIFCDLPWSLPETADHRRAELATLQPEGMARYSRLYALGVDAYRLLPYLRRPAAGPAHLFAGVTGDLRLEAGNRVQRELSCARFADGVPVALTPPLEDATGITIMDEEPIPDVMELEPTPGAWSGGGGPGGADAPDAGTEAPRP